MDEFFSFLEGTSIDMAGEDHWLWLEDYSTLFTMTSTYLALYDLRIGYVEIDVLKIYGNSYSTEGFLFVVENILG